MSNEDNSKYDRIQQVAEDIKRDFMEHRKEFLITLVFLYLAAILVTSFFVQLVLKLIGEQDYITIVGLFTAFAKNWFTVLLQLFVFYAFCNAAYKLRHITEKDYVQDYEENYKRSKYGIYGDAHWQTEEERDECFIRDKDITNIKGDILGTDKNGYIYTLRSDLMGINQNKIAFGAAGSGKSAAIVLNDLFQAFARGDSVICTDSKGDVYRDTCAIAKHFGYIVRVINLKPEELENSDGWEPLKYISKKNTIQADVLAKAIIQNTEDKIGLDYWAKNELNALKATFLLVAISENYEGHRSMSEVINILENPDSFDSKFVALPDTHPAKKAFNIYAQAKPEVRGQILNGLGSRLSLLMDPLVKEIVSHDDIDLVLPMKRKCIYFIIISDTDTTMKFVASMFFTQLFMAQCNYSDGLTKEQKKKQLSVKYELDEFKNIGEIPFFDVKIATFRSRKINSTLILQGVTQLQEMYPNDRHEAILANTTTKILLKAGDLVTAQYFSDLCGQVTVKVENGRYSKGRSQMLDLHDMETVTEGLGKRELLLPDKAMKLNTNIMVVCILGFQPVKLNKFIAEKCHPTYQLSKEMPPNRHVPKWRRDNTKREREVQEKMAAMLKEQEEKAKAEDTAEEQAVKKKPVAPKKQASGVTIKKPVNPKPVSNPQVGNEKSAASTRKTADDKIAQAKKPTMKVEESKMEKPVLEEYFGEPDIPLKEEEETNDMVLPFDLEDDFMEPKKEDKKEEKKSKKVNANKPVFSLEEVEVLEEKEEKSMGRLAAAMNTATKGDSLFDDLF